jgi:hypothetical protein
MEQPPPEQSAPRRKHPRSETRRKQRRITYRVSEDDYHKIEALASAAGLSIASYSRSRAADPPTTGGRNLQPVDCAALATVLRAFTRVAVNINQIARRLNSDGIAVPEELIMLAIRLDEDRVAVMVALGRGR